MLSLGRIVYFFTLPLLRVILNGSHRTRIIVVVNNEILLVKPWLGSGAWMLPGGGIDKGEKPIRAAARELHEETGIRCKSSALLRLGTVPFKHNGFVYTNDVFQLHLTAKPKVYAEQFLEIADFLWVSPQRLPENCSPEVSEALRLGGLVVVTN